MDLIAIANVACDRYGSLRDSQSGPRLFEGLQVSRTHYDLSTFGREGARQSLANSHRSAGDHYDLIAATHDVDYSRTATSWKMAGTRHVLKLASGHLESGSERTPSSFSARCSALPRYGPAPAHLRAAVQRADRRVSGAGRAVWCGTRSGRWPCPSRLLGRSRYCREKV